MLKQLYINNFTLIDTLDIPFNQGFSVITGETGAGKSIIIGAINLLLGQRADTKCIKHNTRKCVIEAHFNVSRYGMQGFFDENGIDYDADDCILRREISPSGKSRAFINDTPVQLSVMRSLGGQLIDIHSQHQNLLLNEEDFQLDVVDIIADDKKLLKQYKDCFAEYKDIRNKVKRKRDEIEENKKNEDFIRFQLNELQDADLKSGMQDELEHESDMLNHVEDIKTSLYNIENILGTGGNSDNGGINNRLKEAVRSLDGITDIYPDAKPLAERLESCYIELKDIFHEISSNAENIEFDPQRLEQVNSKLDTIYSLEQKHNVKNVEDLLSLKAEYEVKLNQINNSDEELSELLAQENQLQERCNELAGELTKVRIKSARKIEKEMPDRLIPLGIPKIRFAVSIEPKELGCNGHDKVAFLFSANTSTPMQVANM